MQIERSAFFVRKVGHIVEVDAAVEGGTNQVLDVGVILDFGDPTLVALLPDYGNELHVFLVLLRVDGLRFGNEVFFRLLEFSQLLRYRLSHQEHVIANQKETAF